MSPDVVAVVPVVLRDFTSRNKEGGKGRPFYDPRSGIAYATDGYALVRVCGLLVQPEGSVQDEKAAAKSDALFENLVPTRVYIHNAYRAARIVRRAVEDRYVAGGMFDCYEDCAVYGLVRVGCVWVQGRYLEKACEAIFATCDGAKTVRAYLAPRGLVLASGEVQVAIARFVLSGPGSSGYLVCDCSTLQVVAGRDVP